MVNIKKTIIKPGLFNIYSIKQPDLYYFETIKMTSLYEEYEPQASILCELRLGL